jgi:reverse gyrase
MLEPIQLPSGKIIDLSKCIAVIPGSKSTDSTMILLGAEQQIQIDSIDLQSLRQQLKYSKIQGKSNVVMETKTPAEESEYRRNLAQKLKAFNSQWERLATDENAKQESDAFKQILDDQRPIGQKLYSAE